MVGPNGRIRFRLPMIAQASLWPYSNYQYPSSIRVQEEIIWALGDVSVAVTPWKFESGIGKELRSFKTPPSTTRLAAAMRRSSDNSLPSCAFWAVLIFLVVFVWRSFLAGPDMPEWSIDDSLPLPRNSIVKTQRSKAHAVATDVCLIGTWSGGRLPIYTRLFFDSIVRNHGYLHLYLFHDVGPELGLNNHKPSGNSDYPNVDFIDIAMIDSSLLFRGFPGFVADRICQIWPNTTTEQCQRLEKAASQTKNLMTQLRGAYGSIFEPWYDTVSHIFSRVNKTNCKAWYIWHSHFHLTGLGRILTWFTERWITFSETISQENQTYGQSVLAICTETTFAGSLPFIIWQSPTRR